jgi:hypothetical protein
MTPRTDRPSLDRIAPANRGAIAGREDFLEIKLRSWLGSGLDLDSRRFILYFVLILLGG